MNIWFYRALIQLYIISRTVILNFLLKRNCYEFNAVKINRAVDSTYGHYQSINFLHIEKLYKCKPLYHSYKMLIRGSNHHFGKLMKERKPSPSRSASRTIRSASSAVIFIPMSFIPSPNCISSPILFILFVGYINLNAFFKFYFLSYT